MAFYKFLDSEKAVSSFCSGQMYFNTPEYYRKIEEKGEIGRNDTYDGMYCGENFETPNKEPIRLVIKPERENSIITCVSHNLKKENLQRMKKMGSLVVVIKDETLFLDKVYKASILNGYKVKARDVQYYEDLDKSIWNSLEKGLDNFTFLKQKEKWEYQQEFRVVLEKDNWEAKFTILGIGNITDISEVVLAEELESVLH